MGDGGKRDEERVGGRARGREGGFCKRFSKKYILKHLWLCYCPLLHTISFETTHTNKGCMNRSHSRALYPHRFFLCRGCCCVTTQKRLCGNSERGKLFDK